MPKAKSNLSRNTRSARRLSIRRKKARELQEYAEHWMQYKAMENVLQFKEDIVAHKNLMLNKFFSQLSPEAQRTKRETIDLVEKRKQIKNEGCLKASEQMKFKQHNGIIQTQETVDKHLEDSDTNKKDEFQPDEIQFKSEPIDIHEEPLLNIKTEPSDLDNSNLFAPVKAEPSDTEVQNENVLEPLTTVLLPTIKTEVFFDENEDSDPFK